MTNILYNGSFEQGWETEPQHGNQIPHGWALMWSPPGDTMLSAGAFPFDDPPIIDTVAAVPECVHKHYLQLPPNEWPGAEDALILDGEYCYKVFGHAFSATLAQNVEVEPGALAVFAVPVQVHHHGDGSPGACAFRVRLNDAASDWITFGHGLPDPANPEWVTVQVSARAAYDGLLHASIDIEGRAEADVSFFIDGAELLIEDEQPQVCRGTPYVQFDRTFVLFPEDATIDQFESLAHTAYYHGHTLGKNADDAGMGDLDNRHVLIVWATPSSWVQADIEARFLEHYPGVTFEHVKLYGEPDPEPPPQDWTPYNYVPTGTKLGFHCVGGYPLDRVQTLAQAGVLLPTVKFLTSLGDLNAAAEPYRIARVIDAGGANAEGFDYNGDPIAQANARMAQLMPVFAPYKSRLGWIEIVNEQAPPYPGTHVKLAQFYIEAMRIADANGYKLALFSHSVGNPTHAAWDEIADTGIFEMAAAGGHAISLHEYGDAQGGPTNVICWYRYLYETHILPRRLDIPLFITEYNVHDVLIGMPNLITQWAAYDALVSQDPYVAGVHLYTLGMVPGPFQERTVAALADFVSYAIAVKDRVNS